MTVCVFENLDGSLRITRPNPRLKRPEETDLEFCQRIADDAVTQDPTLAGLPRVYLDELSVPTDRRQRHAWRLRADHIVVDMSVPTPRHPKQGSLDEIDRAQSLGDLKAALRRMLGG